MAIGQVRSARRTGWRDSIVFKRVTRYCNNLHTWNLTIISVLCRRQIFKLRCCTDVLQMTRMLKPTTYLAGHRFTISFQVAVFPVSFAEPAYAQSMYFASLRT
jgi:hypothetical protein